MNSQKKEKLSFRTAMSYSWRGLTLWWKAAPQLILSGAAQRAAAALAPYLPLYFTARLVNAIAGDGDAGEVWRMLAALLVSTAVAGAVQAAVRCWEDTMRNSCQWPTWDRLFFEKLLSMDFCDVDDPRTQVLLTQIRQERNWNAWGLDRVCWNTADLAGAVFRILGAAALSVSLFTMPVPQGSPLTWLNHPLCMAGMAALMVIFVLGASALANKSNSYWAKHDGTAGNRIFGFFGFIAMSERQRGTDIRVYEQDQFIEKKCKRELVGGGGFGVNSGISRTAWGPMGVCRGASAAVSQAFTGVIYLFAGLKALGGAFGVGSITQYVGALAGLAQGITSLLETIGDLRANAEFLKRTYELLDTPNNMYQGSLTTEKRSDRKYEIEFKDVSFKYPGTETWALRHVSMKFRVGERLAVVGENGSGKTTFIKLLCRLYDPTEGEILLNGIDIRKYRYDNYLDLFS
ncbi:MAG: ABC transporter ATP-binding protein/permease, partial [Muribaculaceae bacterium]|nr:ABC transporter ATP-binding protein/permease [Muribaculaceae bacterium]